MVTKPPPEKPRQMRPLAMNDVDYWKEAKEVEKLASQAGYTWRRGMHPDEVLPMLRAAFSEIISFKQYLSEKTEL